VSQPDLRLGYHNGRFDITRVPQENVGGALNGSGACVPLKPGETLVERIEVSKLYNLTKPGKFVIQVERGDPESTAPVRANAVTVTVTQ
jgi:hypothetical protein